MTKMCKSTKIIETSKRIIVAAAYGTKRKSDENSQKAQRDHRCRENWELMRKSKDGDNNIG